MKTFCILCGFLLLVMPAIRSQNAPVITAGQVTDADPESPSIPVEVTATGFSNIGNFTLTLKFDTLQLHFVSAIANPSLPGMTAIYTPPSGNTQGKIIFSWTGSSNVSLSDESSIASLNFQYVGGTGILSWAYTFGSVCQLKRYNGGTLTLLNDSPKYNYYINGGISNRSAPLAHAPVIAFPEPGSLPVVVTTSNFNSIGAFTLYLEYDPTIITYLNLFTPDSVFGSAFQVGDNSGSGGKRLIIIQWYGEALSLPDQDTICILNFNYPVSSCTPCLLRWIDNGPSCEFSDESGNVLPDMPQTAYYSDGVVASGILNTWSGNAGSAWDDAGNWNNCGIPDSTRDIVIPDVSPRSFPVVTTAGHCRSIHIESGATLTISPSGTITVGDN
jgi:hypothetical protein